MLNPQANQMYKKFIRPSFLDEIYRRNTGKFLVTAEGAYIQKTAGALDAFTTPLPVPPPPQLAPPPPPLAPPLPPVAHMKYCCYRLNDTDAKAIYDTWVTEKYHIAHIINRQIVGRAVEEGEGEGEGEVARAQTFVDFSLLQYCLAGLFGITDDIHILRDVAYSNFQSCCKLFGKDWKSIQEFAELGPTLTPEQRIIAINTGPVIYDPGGTTTTTTDVGRENGFRTVGSKSLCGVCIGTTTVSYPKFTKTILNENDPIGILMYSKYNSELVTNGLNEPIDSITFAELKRRLNAINTTLNIYDDESPGKKKVYSVTRDDSSKETDPYNVPLLETISNVFSNGRVIITESGPKKIASKKYGDSGIQLNTSEPSIEYMLIEPKPDGVDDDGFATNYKLIPSISNGIHGSFTYDRTAFIAGLKYGGPLVMFNSKQGLQVCVSKELAAKYANEDFKIKNAKSRFVSSERIYTETVVMNTKVDSEIGDMMGKYNYIIDLLDSALRAVEIALPYNDHKYQHVLSLWYLFTPILRLRKEIELIPQNYPDPAILAAKAKLAVPDYWTPPPGVDLATLNLSISGKEKALSAYKSSLSNLFSRYELYKNVDLLFQGVITRYNIHRAGAFVDGVKFLQYYYGMYNPPVVNLQEKRGRFKTAFINFSKTSGDIINIVTGPANSPKIAEAVPYKKTNGKRSLRCFQISFGTSDIDYFNTKTIEYIHSNLNVADAEKFKNIMNIYFTGVKAGATNKQNVTSCLASINNSIPTFINASLLVGGMRGGTILNREEEKLIKDIECLIYKLLTVKACYKCSDNLTTKIDKAINNGYACLSLPMPEEFKPKIEQLNQFKEKYVSTGNGDDGDGKMFTDIPEDIKKQLISIFVESIKVESIKDDDDDYCEELIIELNKYIEAPLQGRGREQVVNPNLELIQVIKSKRLAHYGTYDAAYMQAELNVLNQIPVGSNPLFALDEMQVAPPREYSSAQRNLNSELEQEHALCDKACGLCKNRRCVYTRIFERVIPLSSHPQQSCRVTKKNPHGIIPGVAAPRKLEQEHALCDKACGLCKNRRCDNTCIFERVIPLSSRPQQSRRVTKKNPQGIIPGAPLSPEVAPEVARAVAPPLSRKNKRSDSKSASIHSFIWMAPNPPAAASKKFAVVPLSQLNSSRFFVSPPAHQNISAASEKFGWPQRSKFTVATPDKSTPDKYVPAEKRIKLSGGGMRNNNTRKRKNKHTRKNMPKRRVNKTHKPKTKTKTKTNRK